MSESINRECILRCGNCGATVTAYWKEGMFKGSWSLRESRGACPTCHERIALRELKTQLCPHCLKLVEKTPDNICPNCRRDTTIRPVIGKVTCPKCSQSVAIYEGDTGPLVCRCGHEIGRDAVERALKGDRRTDEAPQYIVLPDVKKMISDDHAIWKHPLSTFSFKSRMQVNEGTYALFLQNGVCKEPCGPRSYLLEDLELTQHEKLDAAMSDDSIVFNTDIYCVLQDMPEFKWGTMTDEFEDAQRSASYTASAHGDIALQVSDPRAFAQYVGFRTVSLSELTAVEQSVDHADGKLIQLVRNLVKSALYNCVKEMDSDALKRPDIKEITYSLRAELDRELSSYGMFVKTLNIAMLKVKKSERSRNVDLLRDLARTELSWQVPGVRVHVYAEDSRYADIDFTGKCRLDLSNEAVFFANSEIKALTPNDAIPDKEAVIKRLEQRIGDLLKTDLAITAQQCIDGGEISDIVDGKQYVLTLRERMTGKLNEGLRGLGLTVSAFSIDLPNHIAPSTELAVHMSRPRRMDAVRRAVEAVYPFKTAPVRAHIRDDSSIFVDVEFRCRAALRIADDDTFFNLSEVKGFLDDPNGVQEATIRAYYAERLAPVVNEIMSQITQNVVDQTNADIRELNRFTAILKDSLHANLIRHLERWGLTLDSLSMDPPIRVAASENLEKLTILEGTRAGAQLEQEIRRIRNDNVIAAMDEQTRLDIHRKESVDMAENAEQTVRLRRMEREQQLKIIELNRGAELDRLVDEIAEAKSARSDEAILQDYKRKYRLRQDQLDSQYAEARRQQQEAFDRENAGLHNDFAKMMAEAENKRAINEIMRKIAESDLTWTQKLDEYDRLRRRTMAQDDADIQIIRSDAEIRVRREQNAIYYQAGEQKIRLDAEQAELLERINRYAEERSERQAVSESARTERRAILDFEQRMRERRDQVAQEIEKLSAQYAHEEKLRGQEVDLKKLESELVYHRQRVEQEEGARRAEAQAEADSRIAQAQAEAKRLESQLSLEEDMLKSAEAYRKTLMETMKAIELARIEGGKTADSASAEDREARQRQSALEKKLDRISNSVGELRGTVRQFRDLLAKFQSHGAYAPTGVPGGSAVYGAPAAPVCPICGRFYSADTEKCPICNVRLTRR